MDIVLKLSTKTVCCWCSKSSQYLHAWVQDATKHGIPVGNTPGVLTETTAEIAAALTLAAARRVAEVRPRTMSNH